MLDRGPAAHYDPSYTTPWWERTQNLYASIGVIAPEYEPDPNGYYCVRPGYVPGEKLRLRANGVTITCTVGDMVADHDLHNWLLVSNWAVELSWSAFTALRAAAAIMSRWTTPAPGPEPAAYPAARAGEGRSDSVSDAGADRSCHRGTRRHRPSQLSRHRRALDRNR
ncbi:MAG: hypothetical protein R2849_09575 [Thermomicrobiales bacterium]